MKAAPALTLTLCLTGTLCSCAGVGTQDFACPGYPSEPRCRSTSAVYRLTDALPHATVRPLPADEAPRLEDALFLTVPR